MHAWSCSAANVCLYCFGIVFVLRNGSREATRPGYKVLGLVLSSSNSGASAHSNVLCSTDGPAHSSDWVAHRVLCSTNRCRTNRLSLL